MEGRHVHRNNGACTACLTYLWIYNGPSMSAQCQCFLGPMINGDRWGISSDEACGQWCFDLHK
jgi:hypothetical protein